MTVATEAKKDAAREARELLFRVAKAKHGVLSAQLAELDLTPVQAHALRRLDPARPLAMSALAEALLPKLLLCDPLALPHAADLARLAAIEFAAGRAIAPDQLEPAYLRDKVALTLVEQGKAR